jgi:hypothetical protein
MRTVRTVLAAVLALAITSPLLAVEKKREQKVPPCPAAQAIERITAGLTLTAEQKSKLDAVCKDFGPRLMEAGKKTDVLTPEQKKVQGEAIQAANAAGKKNKEWFDAVGAAVKLSETQKTQQARARQQRFALEKELHEKALAILTAQQREQLQKKPGAAKGQVAKIQFQVVMVQSAKAQPVKAQAAPSPVPPRLVGTPMAKRFLDLQAEIEAASAKLGPAQQEAEKARKLAFQAEQKVSGLKQTVAMLEQDRVRLMQHADAQAREAAVQKAADEKQHREEKRWGETQQKIARLEGQVFQLTSQLEAVKQQKLQSSATGQHKEKKLDAAAGKPAK